MPGSSKYPPSQCPTHKSNSVISHSPFANKSDVLSLLSLLMYAKNFHCAECVFQRDEYCRMILSLEWHVPLELKGIYVYYQATEL